MTASSWPLRLLWLLAVLLAVPGLAVGPVYDDWFHAIDVEVGTSFIERLFSLYDFFRADEVPLSREVGLLPWWADDGLSIRFFRPLSSLVLSLDHLFLDGGGLLSHLHALVWFALLVVLAWRLYRLLFGPEDAVWCSVVYALLGVHMLPLAFTAARHSHVTAVFGFAALECLVRWVRSGGRPLVYAGGLLFALGLLAGESAVAVLPLGLALIWAERGPKAAIGSAVPAVMVLSVYGAAYAAVGYGSHGSAAYLDPFSVEFLAALPSRFVVLLGGLFATFPVDLWLLGAEPLLMVLGVLASALAGFGLRLLLPRLAAPEARRLLALLAGALLSLVPLAAGIPGGRLLVIPGLAGAALMGLCLRRLRELSRERGWLQGGVLGVWLLLFGLGLSGLLRAAAPLDLGRFARELPIVTRKLAERCSGATALALGAPDSNVAYYASLLLAAPLRPRAFHIVSMAPGEHRLIPRGPRKYELAISGDFSSLPWARIYREGPLHAGLSRSLLGIDIETLEASSAGTRLSLSLHEDPDARGCWFTLQQGQLVPLQTPETEPVAWTPTGRAM